MQNTRQNVDAINFELVGVNEVNDLKYRYYCKDLDYYLDFTLNVLGPPSVNFIYAGFRVSTTDYKLPNSGTDTMQFVHVDGNRYQNNWTSPLVIIKQWDDKHRRYTLSKSTSGGSKPKRVKTAAKAKAKKPAAKAKKPAAKAKKPAAKKP